MAEQPIVSNNEGKLSAKNIADNFTDLHPTLTTEQVIFEANRCLFCYDAPCVTACPTAIDIPKFIRQIATKNLTGSARTILSANIMGGTCARACPTEILCEQVCVLNKSEQQPVSIGNLQRHSVDYLLARGGDHPFVRAQATGKKIAIIGAGPTGLACAHALAVNGHDIQIFEARSKPGGLNEYGLAAYKMVDDFAAKEAKFITDIGGICINYNQVLGRDVLLAELQQQYDAVFIGIGLEKGRDLKIPGEQLGGVQNALDFIASIRQAADLSKLDPGAEVVVIGGGNTAIDMAVQAKRLGAKNVTLAYRRGPMQMGATKWEQELALKNEVKILYWASPKEIIGSNKVSAISFEKMQMKAAKYCGSGEYFTIAADRVFTAVGQILVDQALQNITVTSGKIVTNSDGQTSVSGVFAGGDCIASGEDLTVQAVQDGKTAAAAIHDYLGGANG